MATQITAWKSSDGKLHESPEAAHRADNLARINDLTREAVATVDRLTSDLTDAALEGGCDFATVKDNLIYTRGQILILELAEAITALRALENS